MADEKEPAFKKPGSGGRPTKLTAELQQKIVNAMRGGAYLETAAALVDVNRFTLQRWLKKGARSKNSDYGRFCVAVERAMAEAEMRDLAVIDKAANGTAAELDENGKQVRAESPRNWHAAAWRLERKFPKKWGRTEKFEHTGAGGGPIQVDDMGKKRMAEASKDPEVFAAMRLVANRMMDLEEAEDLERRSAKPAEHNEDEPVEDSEDLL